MDNDAPTHDQILATYHDMPPHLRATAEWAAAPYVIAGLCRKLAPIHTATADRLMGLPIVQDDSVHGLVLRQRQRAARG